MEKSESAFESLRRRARFRSSILLVAVVATGAAAEEYSWQVSGGVQRLEMGDDVEQDVGTLDLTYYFRAVDDDAGPYALAPFLERSSRIGASVQRDDQNQTATLGTINGLLSSSVSVVETDAWSISGRHVWRSSGWYAGGTYRRGDVEYPQSAAVTTDVDLDAYGLRFGKYVAASSTVEIGWDVTTTTRKQTVSNPISCYPFPCGLVPSEMEVEVGIASIAARHVGDIGRMAYSVSGRVTSSRVHVEAVFPDFVVSPNPPVYPPVVPPNGPPVGGRVPAPVIGATAPRHRTYTIGGELFPTQRLGIGVGYTRWDGDPLLEGGYDVAATWFFVRRAALRVALSRTEREILGLDLPDSDMLSVRLLGRF